MSDCEFLSECSFFNIAGLTEDGLMSIYKQKYCHDDNRRCARFVAFLVLNDIDVIPDTLYPNMLDDVKDLVLKVGASKKP